MKSVPQLVAEYDLKPHPEGGYYAETYRSPACVQFPGFDGPRHVATGIYFLLPAGKVSRLHRIKSDEMWHFYAGGPLTIVEITPLGKVLETTLGPGRHQHVVAAGHWFGSLPASGSDYSFVGCTVAPGFDFRDFELAARGPLLAAFPQAQAWIQKLT